MTQRRLSMRRPAALALVTLVFALALLFSTGLRAATTYSITTLPEQQIGGSEIIDVSNDNKFAAVVGKNDAAYRLRLINLTTKTFVQPSFDLQGALNAAGFNLGLTAPVASSVAISPVDNNGTYYAIVTLREQAEMTTNPGKVVLVNISAAGQGSLRRDSSNNIIPPITVGVNPESVDIARNGEFAVVANQGGMGNDVDGSISIIDLRPSTNYAVQTFTPTAPNPQPETVEIGDDSLRAFVTLQQSNGINIIDIDTSVTPLRFSQRTEIFSTGLRPDGLALSPDSNYLVTANELAIQKSVSLFRVNKESSTLTLLDTVTTPTTPATPFGYTPEMAATGLVGGQLRAFFSLQQPNALGVYIINRTTNRLELETIVSLNTAGQPNAVGPEGVAFAEDINLIVTANSESRNVSMVQVTTDDPPPPPPPTNDREYMPLLFK